MITKTVDLSHIPNLDLDSVTVRSVNGDDSMDAAGRCLPPDGSQLDINMFGLLMRQQMMIQAITNYTLRADKTTKTCVAPPMEAVKWSNRTKEFVGEIYDHVNSVSMDERESFRKALANPQPTPGS